MSGARKAVLALLVSAAALSLAMSLDVPAALQLVEALPRALAEDDPCATATPRSEGGGSRHGCAVSALQVLGRKMGAAEVSKDDDLGERAGLPGQGQAKEAQVEAGKPQAEEANGGGRAAARAAAEVQTQGGAAEADEVKGADPEEDKPESAKVAEAEEAEHGEEEVEGSDAADEAKTEEGNSKEANVVLAEAADSKEVEKESAGGVVLAAAPLAQRSVTAPKEEEPEFVEGDHGSFYRPDSPLLDASHYPLYPHDPPHSYHDDDLYHYGYYPRGPLHGRDEYYPHGPPHYHHDRPHHYHTHDEYHEEHYPHGHYDDTDYPHDYYHPHR